MKKGKKIFKATKLGVAKNEKKRSDDRKSDGMSMKRKGVPFFDEKYKKKKAKKNVENEQASTSQSLVDKMQEKLKGAHFRIINEAMYTKTGCEALEMFKECPETFQVYHEGYEMQKKHWPVDPLDVVIQQIKNVPRKCVVADMGCGSARLAFSVSHTVHSFDFIAANENVTACDMSNVPLKNESVDICVFCLSLMGTNLSEYLLEANRILKPKGKLKIVEIFNRLSSVREFKRCLDKLGFELTQKAPIGDDDYFILMNFEKVGKPKQKNPSGLFMKPCLYKKR